MRRLEIDDIQTIVNIVIGSIISINLIYYYLYGDRNGDGEVEQIKIPFPFIFIHSMIHFFNCKPEIIDYQLYGSYPITDM